DVRRASWSRVRRLQRLQERAQVGDLVTREADVEPAVVELDHLVDGVGRAIVEVGRARRQAAQGRPLLLRQVGELAGQDRAAEVGDLLGGAGGAAGDSEQR